MSAFTDAIARHLAGVRFFSVGCQTGCRECNGADTLGFFWSACEGCGAKLGGDRFPAHGFVTLKSGAEVLEHLAVCGDCLFFHANGEEPDVWIGPTVAPAGWEVAETLPAVSEMSGNQLRALREARETEAFPSSPGGMVAGWIAEQREMGVWDGE